MLATDARCPRCGGQVMVERDPDEQLTYGAYTVSCLQCGWERSTPLTTIRERSGFHLGPRS